MPVFFYQPCPELGIVFIGIADFKDLSKWRIEVVSFSRSSNARTKIRIDIAETNQAVALSRSHEKLKRISGDMF